MKSKNAVRHVIVAFAVTIVLAAGVLTWIVRSTPEKVGAEFGTTFTLTDNRGQPITDKALTGQPSLVFFGFTHCPEICPTTLYEMSSWFEQLGDEGKAVKGFFFTVDPERDTPEIMNDYTQTFTDRITGVTGSPQEMERVRKAWRIFARKVPTSDGEYTMDHTASVLMLDSKGNFKGIINYGETAENAVAKIRELLKAG